MELFFYIMSAFINIATFILIVLLIIYFTHYLITIYKSKKKLVDQKEIQINMEEISLNRHLKTDNVKGIKCEVIPIKNKED